MKKWDEDGEGCVLCMGYAYASCLQWRREISTKENLKDYSIRRCRDGESYANKEQIEAMLKWCEEKAKAKAVPEFRVRDKVSIVAIYKGIVTKIRSKEAKYPIIVTLNDGDDYQDSFNLNGEIDTGMGRVLYHGHNIKIREDIPVRPKKTREAWVVMTHNAEREGLNFREFKTEKDAINFCCNSWGAIVSSPIKVEVPE